MVSQLPENYFGQLTENYFGKFGRKNITRYRLGGLKSTQAPLGRPLFSRDDFGAISHFFTIVRFLFPVLDVLGPEMKPDRPWKIDHNLDQPKN